MSACDSFLGFPRSARLASIASVSALLLLLAWRPAPGAVQPSGDQPPPALLAQGLEAPLRLRVDTAPTVAVTPAQGHGGQRVRASGRVPVGAAGVRLVWRLAGTTRMAVVVTPGTSGGFQAELTVPEDAPAGAAEVCAAVTGVERAVFGCAPFQVLPAPPGSVMGRLPAGVEHTAGETFFLLLDGSGATVRETALLADGSFRLDGVAPGTYRTAIVGPLTQTVFTSVAVVRPSQTTVVDVRPVPPMGSCSSKLLVTQVNLSPSASSGTQNPLGGGAGEATGSMVGSSSYDFGLYVAGVAVPATLTVSTQGKPDGLLTKEKPPLYKFVSASGQLGPRGAMTSAGQDQRWRAQIDLGQITTAGIWELHVIPQDSSHGEDYYCETVNHARFMADPMRQSLIFQPASSKTTWNSSKGWYEFEGWVPNMAGLLPLRYPQTPWRLPLLGEATNEFDAGLYVKGFMTLDRTMHFEAFKLQASAKVLGFSVMNKQYTPNVTPQSFNPDNPASLTVALPTVSLWQGNWNTQVYEGILATYWDVVTVKAAVSVGLLGDFSVRLTLQPLVPAFDLALLPSITPYLELRIWLDVLLGVASAGADASAYLGVTLPFHIAPADQRKAWFDSPCVGFRLDMVAWARINLGFWKKKWRSDPINLVNENSCGHVNPAPPQPPAAPKLLGAPAIAASPDGGMLVVFVGDADPGGQSPKPKIFALYKAPGASGWPDPSHAVALTDGTTMVQDPAVAFALNPPKAFVFWTQTNISSSDEDRAGNDINKILDRQDIYMRAGFPDKNKWDAIQAVTNDPANSLYADGRPAASGDDLGVTLAWVRGTTTPFNRSFTRIAVKSMDANGWGPMRLIEDQENGMRAQPTVARAYFFDDVHSRWVTKRYLAYTVNADLSAPGPRRIRAWVQDGTARDLDLVDMTGSGLPDNAMSPALGIDYWGSPMLAYLLGTVDPRTAPSADPTAVLYFARVSGLPGMYQWYPTQMTRNCSGCDQLPIRAEKPSFAWAPAAKHPALVFREFGEAGTQAQVGHIARIDLTYSDRDTRPISIYYQGTLPQGPGANWQPATGMQQLRPHDLEVCWLEGASPSSQAVAALEQLRPGSPLARVAAPVSTLDTSVETLKIATVQGRPDSALDPLLQMEPRHAGAGTTVTITATVRNLGRAPVSGLTVDLYHDDDGVLSTVGTKAIAGTLGPGESAQVSWEVEAKRGQQVYHAILGGGEDDIGDLNNHAHGVLNALGRPRLLTIVPSHRFPHALELGWEMEGHVAAASYRVLRAVHRDGPYELVGETTGLSFVDPGLTRGWVYFYKVQAVDADGTLSEASAPLSGMLQRYTGVRLPRAR